MSIRTYLFRAATAAAVLAPFLLSVAAHAVPVRLAATPVSERPSLRFGEYLVNLGRLPEGARANGVFRFKNDGDSELSIGDLFASCGCLTPILEQTTYAPGEAGMFVVRADTAGEAAVAGDTLKEHYVDVPYTTDGEKHVARVHLKFVLPERHVTVEPRSLLVYQFGTQATHREIVVTDHRMPPLNVIAVESRDSALMVDEQIAESGTDPQRATIAVTVPATLDRNVETRLIVRTDDPEQPTIQIPIVVQVRSEPAKVGGVPLDLIPAGSVQK